MMSRIMSTALLGIAALCEAAGALEIHRRRLLAACVLYETQAGELLYTPTIARTDGITPAHQPDNPAPLTRK